MDINCGLFVKRNWHRVISYVAVGIVLDTFKPEIFIKICDFGVLPKIYISKTAYQGGLTMAVEIVERDGI